MKKSILNSCICVKNEMAKKLLWLIIKSKIHGLVVKCTVVHYYGSLTLPS